MRQRREKLRPAVPLADAPGEQRGDKGQPQVHFRAIVEQLVNQDPVLQALQLKIVENELVVERYKDRAVNPDTESGYKKALRDIESARAEMRQRRVQVLRGLEREISDMIRESLKKMS